MNKKDKALNSYLYTLSLLLTLRRFHIISGNDFVNKSNDLAFLLKDALDE